MKKAEKIQKIKQNLQLINDLLSKQTRQFRHLDLYEDVDYNKEIPATIINDMLFWTEAVMSSEYKAALRARQLIAESLWARYYRDWDDFKDMPECIIWSDTTHALIVRIRETRPLTMVSKGKLYAAVKAISAEADKGD